MHYALDFLDIFPDLKSYLQYNAPYYKIRIGDYLTKLEAQKDLIEIKKKYRGAYPVPCFINLEEVIKKESKTPLFPFI